MKYKLKVEVIIDVDLDNGTPLTDRAIIKRHLKQRNIFVSSFGGGGSETIRGKDYPIFYNYDSRNKLKITSIKRKK